MGKAWKAAAIFGGLAVTIFLAYTQLSPDSQFDTALLVASLIFTGFFAISGIIYILLWLKPHFKRESGNRVTHYSGRVYINKKRAGAGLKVTAKVGDYKSASVTTNAAGYYNKLEISPPNDSYIGLLTEFYIDGEKASRTEKTSKPLSYMDGGHSGEIDLDVISLQASNIEKPSISPRVASPELFFDSIKYKFVGDNPPLLHIKWVVSATGVMHLEQAKIEILGGFIPITNWESRSVGSTIGFMFEHNCKFTEGLPAGNHDIRIQVFANREWWASNWQTITYSPSVPGKEDSPKK